MREIQEVKVKRSSRPPPGWSPIRKEAKKKKEKIGREIAQRGGGRDSAKTVLIGQMVNTAPGRLVSSMRRGRNSPEVKGGGKNRKAVWTGVGGGPLRLLAYRA